MKAPVRLTRGRYGIILPAKTLNILKNIIVSEGITLQILADRMGISRSQLAHPLNGGGCSKESFEKISEFMENIKQ